MTQKVFTKQDLINKYQKELDEMIIMDDFDAGKATSMKPIKNWIIKDFSSLARRNFLRNSLTPNKKFYSIKL